MTSTHLHGNFNNVCCKRSKIQNSILKFNRSRRLYRNISCWYINLRWYGNFKCWYGNILMLTRKQSEIAKMLIPKHCANFKTPISTLYGNQSMKEWYIWEHNNLDYLHKQHSCTLQQQKTYNRVLSPRIEVRPPPCFVSVSADTETVTTAWRIYMKKKQLEQWAGSRILIER